MDCRYYESVGRKARHQGRITARNVPDAVTETVASMDTHRCARTENCGETAASASDDRLVTPPPVPMRGTVDARAPDVRVDPAARGDGGTRGRRFIAAVQAR